MVRPGFIRFRCSAGLLVKLVAIYSCCALGAISALVLLSEETSVHDKAIIKMALGLNLLWCVLCGMLMRRFGEPLGARVRAIPLPWRLKFILFATALALAEEAITVSMTNLAPLFGSEVGKAFITASANYLHTVLFHSVIVFIPMFVAWSFLLGRYDFSAASVFLLFGLTGSLAEMSMQPMNILGGFWFFVYGLMVYVPVRALPPASERGARPPQRRHYALAVVLPLVSPVLLLPFAPLLSYLYRVMAPEFFVETPFG